jgi:hypothetical protein
MFMFFAAATDPVAPGLYLSLGAVIFGMGLVLTLLGLKSSTVNEPMRVIDDGPSLPLSYIETVLQEKRSRENIKSGNRAFGFVLISLGAFVLAVFASFGIFLGWILLPLGGGLVISGALLRFR